ncbi:MAG: CRISPR system precrRNA processing endoribonuclease RAMP protein Cas6 [Ardenticatenia bacterium]|nr:MAG: CRISPR system precrRNA processing endoribonuclease RAMP protein Cas6 [Ardenticatenia bacterium]
MTQPLAAQPPSPTQSSFTAYRLWFTVEVETPLELSAWPGSALRGALLNALRRHYCYAPNDPNPAHSMQCPVCWLMARESSNWRWGRTPARPYTIDLDPVHHATRHRYAPGDRFGFGVTLFGVAFNLLPYLILAVSEMGRIGVGRPLREDNGRRGRFRLYQVEAVHPLTGERELVLLPNSTVVQTPTLHANAKTIAKRAKAFLARTATTQRLTVRFLTPTRLVHRKQLVKEPLFRPLVARALDRIEALSHLYTHDDVPSRVPGMSSIENIPDWLAKADTVRLVEHETQWIDIQSYSKRTQRATPVGGFVGYAVYEAETWTPFVPVLLWAQVAHVGKDAVKGNGAIAVLA